MNRRQFLNLTAAGLGAAGLSHPALISAATKAPPNIVFIMSDDHALEAISCYGKWLKDVAKTPNIDRLAAEGMRFNNVCCNNSICSPSRANILTGQYSHKNGVPGLGGTIAKDAPLYPVELKQAGYQTAIVGKWHLGSSPTFYDYSCVVKGQGNYFDPTFSVDGKTTEQVSGYSTDVYTDKALAWLDKRDRDRPFLLCLQFKAPHHPYDYAPRHDDLFEGTVFPEPPTLYEDVEQTSPELKAPYWAYMDRSRGYFGRHEKDTKPPMGPTGGRHDASDKKSRVAAAYQHMLLKYIRCVTAVDENVGRVLKHLDEHGLTRSTLVVYTADQGYWLGQHGMYDKRLILDGSLKMPFLARYPQEIEAGAVCDELCSNVDFAETFLDYAGVKPPAAMQGRSMRPLLKGERPADWPDAIFYSYWSPPAHYGLRTKRYTLARVSNKVWELYDNQTDPEQVRNVADNPKYADVLADLRRRLAGLIKKVDIPESQLPGIGKPASGKSRGPSRPNKKTRTSTSTSIGGSPSVSAGQNAEAQVTH